MKKLIITSLFTLGIFTQNCFGQLKVDSSGRLGIGNGNISSNYTASITTLGHKNG